MVSFFSDNSASFVFISSFNSRFSCSFFENSSSSVLLLRLYSSSFPFSPSSYCFFSFCSCRRSSLFSTMYLRIFAFVSVSISSCALMLTKLAFFVESGTGVDSTLRLTVCSSTINRQPSLHLRATADFRSAVAAPVSGDLSAPADSTLDLFLFSYRL